MSIVWGHSKRNISARCFTGNVGVSESWVSSGGTGTCLWWPRSDPGEKNKLGLRNYSSPMAKLGFRCDINVSNSKLTW